MAYHYWVGNITGYVFSTGNVCPILKPPDRMKYMGTTEDIMWPKRMNTGRILYKSKKPKKRKKKLC